MSPAAVGFSKTSNANGDSKSMTSSMQKGDELINQDFDRKPVTPRARNSLKSKSDFMRFSWEKTGSL